MKLSSADIPPRMRRPSVTVDQMQKDPGQREGETGPGAGRTGIKEGLAGIVKAVGKELISWRKEGITDGAWEGSQFKATADKLAHSRIREELEALHPGIPVVSEEDEGSWGLRNPDRYFLVDPIDGTASFAGGFDGFVTQVALMEGQEPRYAAIYAPALDALYTAGRGEGAYLNSRRLEIPDPASWESLVDNYPVPRGITREAFEGLQLTRYVECGSISLKICMVADGTADIFFKAVPVKDWDIAAPHLVLGEAGGFLRELGGRDIAYDRGMEYNGIVAAKSIAHAMRIISWYSKRKERGSSR